MTQLDNLSIFITISQTVLISGTFFLFLFLIHTWISCRFFFFHFFLKFKSVKKLNNILMSLDSSKMRCFDSVFVLMKHVTTIFGKKFANSKFPIPCSIKQTSLSMNIFVVNITPIFNQNFTCLNLTLFCRIKQRCLVHVIVFV